MKKLKIMTYFANDFDVKIKKVKVEIYFASHDLESENVRKSDFFVDLNKFERIMTLGLFVNTAIILCRKKLKNALFFIIQTQ